MKYVKLSSVSRPWLTPILDEVTTGPPADDGDEPSTDEVESNEPDGSSRRSSTESRRLSTEYVFTPRVREGCILF